MKKRILIMASLIGAISCSSNKALQEITGISRISVHQESYVKPDFMIGDVDFKEKQASRSIASTSEFDSTNLSNRQLYFLSAYKQYEQLRSITNSKETISSCPSFHGVVLEYRESLKSYDKFTATVNLESVKSEKNNAPYYPVLALPYSSSKDLYTSLETSSWSNADEHTRSAITAYAKKQYKEVATLCDRGVSPGYYIFENLVTYFKKDTKFHKTTKGLKAMLKVPAVANMIVIDNFKKNQFSFVDSTFDNALLERANVEWFKSFRDNLKTKRTKHFSQLNLKKI